MSRTIPKWLQGGTARAAHRAEAACRRRGPYPVNVIRGRFCPIIAGYHYERFLMVTDRKSGPPRWLLRLSRVGFSVLVLGPSIVLASVEVCQPPDAYSRVSLAFVEQHRSDLDGGLGRVARQSQNFDLLYRLNDAWSLGAGHRYVIVDTDPVELQTNGHLHTLFFPLHRQSHSDGKSFRFSIAPALSASSNVMKDPGEYRADTFQLLAAIVWSKELSEQAALRLGLCGDHSFGRYLVYPSITFDWHPRPDLAIELGVPASRLTYEASRTIELSLRVFPDGNEWHVKSKDLEKQSRLVSRALLIEWALRWQAGENLGIGVGVARAFSNRYDVSLLDESRVELSHDAALRISAALEWRF